MKAFILFLALGFTTQWALAEIVYYKDEEGNLHAADSPDLIPAKYRKKLKTLASGDTGAATSTLTKESFKIEPSNGRSVVMVNSGGTQFYMAIEPDTPTSTLHPSLVSKLGIKIGGPTEVTSASSNPDPKAAKGSVLSGTVSSIGINQFQVRNLQVQIVEMKGYGKAEGILGQDYFKNFRTIVEMDKSLLTLERK